MSAVSVKDKGNLGIYWGGRSSRTEHKFMPIRWQIMTEQNLIAFIFAVRRHVYKHMPIPDVLVHSLYW